MLGTWIDGLSEEEKDRIVRAQRWTYGAFVRGQPYEGHVTIPAGRCLMAQVKDITDVTTITRNDVPTWVTQKYDALCVRFGLDRVVRAIKLRAGASVEDLEPVSTAPTSSAGAHG